MREREIGETRMDKWMDRQIGRQNNNCSSKMLFISWRNRI